MVKNMGNILFVTDRFFPNPTAITFCLEPILNNVVSRGHNCFVFTTRDAKELPYVENINGVKVYRVDNWIYYADTYSKKLIGTSGLKRFFGRCYNKILNIVCYKKPENYRYYFNNNFTKKALVECIEDNRIDTIVSVSSPFSVNTLTRSALKEIDRKIKWIIYEFDPYTYNYRLDKNTTNERMELEENTIRDCDSVIALFGIKEENISRGFKSIDELDSKINSIVLPNLVVDGKNIASCVRMKLENNTFKLMHTGNIYSPKYLQYLKVLSKELWIKISLKMFGLGTSALEDHTDWFDMEGFGFVSYEERHNHLNNCDALLLCGDPCPNQFPSKLSYYLSTGKPVLHLRQSDSDVCMMMLQHYKNYFSINITDDSDINMDELRNFIIGTPKSITDIDTIRNNMKDFLSEKVISQIMVVIE